MYGYTPKEREYLKLLTDVLVKAELNPRLRFLNKLLEHITPSNSDSYDDFLAEKRVTEDLIALLTIYGEDGFVEFGF